MLLDKALLEYALRFKRKYWLCITKAAMVFFVQGEVSLGNQILNNKSSLSPMASKV